MLKKSGPNIEPCGVTKIISFQEPFLFIANFSPLVNNAPKVFPLSTSVSTSKLALVDSIEPYVLS